MIFGKWENCSQDNLKAISDPPRWNFWADVRIELGNPYQQTPFKFETDFVISSDTCADKFPQNKTKRSILC